MYPGSGCRPDGIAAKVVCWESSVGVGVLASEQATAGDFPAAEAPAERAERGVFDKWLVWGIALCAIIVPGLFLTLISSMQTHTFADLTDCKAAAGRGEFLIPDALLLIECCRRLTREVFPENKFWQGLKIAVVIVCATAALLCFAASIVLVTDPTDKTMKSAIDLTLWCLGIGLVAGTIAVAVRNGEP